MASLQTVNLQRFRNSHVWMLAIPLAIITLFCFGMGLWQAHTHNRRATASSQSAPRKVQSPSVLNQLNTGNGQGLPTTNPATPPSADSSGSTPAITPSTGATRNSAIPAPSINPNNSAQPVNEGSIPVLHQIQTQVKQIQPVNDLVNGVKGLLGSL